jgi:ABC-type uncharacterized transport system permease subunit
VADRLVQLPDRVFGKDSWKLVAQDRSSNKDLWQQPLPAEPVRWAVTVDAQARIIVALRDGRVLCFGRASE